MPPHLKSVKAGNLRARPGTGGTWAGTGTSWAAAPAAPAKPGYIRVWDFYFGTNQILTAPVLSLWFWILSQTSRLPVGQQGPRRGQKRSRVSCWSSSWPHWPTGLLTEDWCCPVQVPSLDSANRFVTCGSNNWYNAEHGKGMQASLRLVAQQSQSSSWGLKGQN